MSDNGSHCNCNEPYCPICGPRCGYSICLHGFVDHCPIPGCDHYDISEEEWTILEEEAGGSAADYDEE
jgi:hypothetical protein